MTSPLLMVNPRKRKQTRKSPPKTRTRTVYKTRYVTPKKRRRNPCLRKRNPAFRFNLNQFTKSLFQAGESGLWGGIGAITGTAMSNMIPLPENLKTPNMKIIIDLLFGMGAGGLIGMMTPGNRKWGEMAAAGAFTVAMYDVVKPWIQGFLPGLELGQYDNGLLGQYNDGLLGRYHNDNSFYNNQLSLDYENDSLGYTNAAVVQDPFDNSMNMGAYSYPTGMGAYEYI